MNNLISEQWSDVTLNVIPSVIVIILFSQILNFKTMPLTPLKSWANAKSELLQPM